VAEKITMVFLTEDDPADVQNIQYLLNKVEFHKFDLSFVDRLSDGLKQLENDQVDVILLDLGKGDEVETYRQTSDWERSNLFIIIRSEIFFLGNTGLVLSVAYNKKNAH